MAVEQQRPVLKRLDPHRALRAGGSRGVLADGAVVEKSILLVAVVAEYLEVQPLSDYDAVVPPVPEFRHDRRISWRTPHASDNDSSPGRLARTYQHKGLGRGIDQLWWSRP